MQTKCTTAKVKSRGFTLIELIVGIVVLSISFSLITTLILPLSEKSAEQLHQVRAAELGQSMMNEILAKAFDENSDMAGGLIRCGENSTVCSSVLGPEDGEDGRPDYGEYTRNLFNDVDDYDGYNFDDENALGDKFSSLYTGFTMSVRVCNDSDYSGPNCDSALDPNISTAKLIIVTVTTPTDFDFVFSFYKANF